MEKDLDKTEETKEDYEKAPEKFWKDLKESTPDKEDEYVFYR